MSRAVLSGFLENEELVQAAAESLAPEHLRSSERNACPTQDLTQVSQAVPRQPEQSSKRPLPPAKKPRRRSQRSTRQRAAEEQPEPERDRREQRQRERTRAQTFEPLPAPPYGGPCVSPADVDARGAVPPVRLAGAASVVDPPLPAAASSNEVVLLSSRSEPDHGAQATAARPGLHRPASPCYRVQHSPSLTILSVSFPAHCTDKGRGDDCVAGEVSQPSRRSRRTSFPVCGQTQTAVPIRSGRVASKRSASGFPKAPESSFFTNESEIVAREVPDACAEKSPGSLDQKQPEAAESGATSPAPPTPSVHQGPGRSGTACTVSCQNQGSRVDPLYAIFPERTQEGTDSRIHSPITSSDQTAGGDSDRARTSPGSERKRKSSITTSQHHSLQSGGNRRTRDRAPQFTASTKTADGTKGEETNYPSETQHVATGRPGERKEAGRSGKSIRRRRHLPSDEVHAEVQSAVHPGKQGRRQSAQCDSHPFTRSSAASPQTAAAVTAQTAAPLSDPAAPACASKARQGRREGRRMENHRPSSSRARQGRTGAGNTGRGRRPRSRGEGTHGEDEERGEEVSGGLTTLVMAFPLSAQSSHDPIISHIPSVPPETACTSPVDTANRPDYASPVYKAKCPDRHSPIDKAKCPDRHSPIDKAKCPDRHSPIDKAKCPDRHSPIDKAKCPDRHSPIDKAKCPDRDSPADKAKCPDRDSLTDKTKWPDGDSPVDKTNCAGYTSSNKARYPGHSSVQIKIETADDEYPPVGITDIQDSATRPTILNTPHPEWGRDIARYRQDHHAKDSSQNADSSREWNILFETPVPNCSHYSSSIDVSPDKEIKEDIDTDIKTDIDINVNGSEEEIKEEIKKDAREYTDRVQEASKSSTYHQAGRSGEGIVSERELSVVKKEFDGGEEKDMKKEPILELTSRFSEMGGSSQAMQPARRDGSMASRDPQSGGRRKQKTPRQFRRRSPLPSERIGKKELMQIHGDDNDLAEQGAGLTDCLTVSTHDAHSWHCSSHSAHAPQSCPQVPTEDINPTPPLTGRQHQKRKRLTQTHGAQASNCSEQIREDENHTCTQGLQMLRNSTPGFDTISNVSMDRNVGSDTGQPGTSSTSIINSRTFKEESLDYRSRIPQPNRTGFSPSKTKAARKVKAPEQSQHCSAQTVTTSSSALSVPTAPLPLMRLPYIPLHYPAIQALSSSLSMFQTHASTSVPLMSTAGVPRVPKTVQHPSYVPIVPKMSIVMPAVPPTLPVWDTSQNTGAVGKEEASLMGYQTVHSAHNTTPNAIPLLNGQYNQPGEANGFVMQGRTPQLGTFGSQMISHHTGSIPVLILLPNVGQQMATSEVRTHTTSGLMATATTSGLVATATTSSETPGPERTATTDDKVLMQSNSEAQIGEGNLDSRSHKNKSHKSDESMKVDSSNEEGKPIILTIRYADADSSKTSSYSNITDGSEITTTPAVTSSKENATSTSATTSTSLPENGIQMANAMTSDHKEPAKSTDEFKGPTSWYFPFQYDACKRAEEIVFSSTSTSQQTLGGLGTAPAGQGELPPSPANTVSVGKSDSVVPVTTAATATVTSQLECPQRTPTAARPMTTTSGHKEPAQNTDESRDPTSWHFPFQYDACKRMEEIVFSTTSSVPSELDVQRTSQQSIGGLDNAPPGQGHIPQTPSETVSVKRSKPAGVSKSGRKRFATTRFDFRTNIALSDASDKEDITPVTSDDEWTPGKNNGLSSHSSDEEDAQAKSRRGDSFLDLTHQVKRKTPKVRRSRQTGQDIADHNQPSRREAPPAVEQSREQTLTCVAKPDIPECEKRDWDQESPAEVSKLEVNPADHGKSLKEGVVEGEDKLSGPQAMSTESASRAPVQTRTPRRRRNTPYTKEELTCRMCNKTFINIYRLRRHEFSHGDERPYVCDLCGKGFKQSGHRNEHRLTHSANKRSFLCNECGVVITSRSSFRYHLLSHKQLMGSVRTAGSQMTGREGSAGSPTPGGGGSEAHPPHTSGKPPENTSGVPTVDPLGSREVEHSLAAAAYDCPHCVLRFATAQSLNCHLESHQEVELRCHVQPFTCRECGRSFTYRHNLRKHRECHAKSEKRADLYRRQVQAAVAAGKPHFVCDTCGKVFLRKETLTKHLKTHLGLKPFQCLECLKRFTQKIHLTVHSRLHTGSRPFQCRTCRCCFLDSTALARHVMRDVCKSEGFSFNVGKRGRKPFHSVMDEKVRAIVRSNRERRQRKNPACLECSQCNWTGKYEGFLRRHIRRHHPTDGQKAAPKDSTPKASSAVKTL